MSYTIDQLNSFPEGTVVPQLEGTVKVVFQRKTGEGQYGPWSLQGLVLQIGQKEIVCTVWGADDLSYLKGKAVSLRAGEDRRSKKPAFFTCINGKDKEGNPRRELKLDVSKGAFIGGDEPNPAYMAGAQQAPATQAPAHTPAPAAQQQGAQAAPAADPTFILEQLASYWEACYERAGKQALTPEARQSFTASLFIEGSRMKLYAAYPLKAVAQEDVPY